MLTDIAEIPIAAPAAPKSRAAATLPWCLYDWAISPYPTIVSTFIISNYFARAIVGDAVAGSVCGFLLKNQLGIAGIAIFPVTAGAGLCIDT